jgi:hypothetical protein
MKKRGLVVFSALSSLLLCSCEAKDSTKFAYASKSDEAWAECMFELDKIEAIRGRNLDDLNRGISVARNQFLVDCMSAKAAVISPDQFSDLGNYSGPSQSAQRNAADINLTNGRR